MPASAAVGGVSGDADRAEHRAGGIADQGAARNRHERAADGMGRRLDEVGPLERHLVQRARTDAERDHAMGLAERDLGALQAGAILRGQEFRRATRIEDGDGEGLEARLVGMGEGGGHYRLGVGERQHRVNSCGGLARL